jgi:hypothetical protein
MKTALYTTTIILLFTLFTTYSILGQNVGIGTTTPDHPLMIKSNVVAANDNTNIMRLEGRNPVVGFRNASGAGAGYIKAWTDAPSSGFATGMIIGASPGDNVYLSVNYSPTMVVHNNGNVGIGITNPTGKLHIQGNNEVVKLTGTTPFISLYSNGVYKGYLWQKGVHDIELGTAGVNTNGNLFISSKGTPRITVTRDGWVKVGSVNDPTLYTAYNYTNPLVMQNGFLIKRSITPLDEWRIYVGPDGRFSFDKNGGAVAWIYPDGSWGTPSDKRLKNSITPYNEVLDKIKTLQVSTYRLNSEPDLTQKILGLIAQEVATHFPEIAQINEETGYYSIAYAKVGVIAIKAIQEQQAIIEKQQQEIDELRMENKKVFERLAAVERALKKKN